MYTYYYMSLCNIPFLTSFLKLLHRFSSNFVSMFLVWTPTKFVEIGVLPLCFMELCAIFGQFLKNPLL